MLPEKVHLKILMVKLVGGSAFTPGGEEGTGKRTRPALLTLNCPEPGFLELTGCWKHGEATVICEQQGCLPYRQRRTNTN